MPDTVKRGHKIEVLAPSKRWREAEVVKVKGDLAVVHYKGYANQFDEQVDLASLRVRPYGELRKTELRDLKESFSPAASMTGHCPGCGAKLQTTDRTRVGYIPPDMHTPSNVDNLHTKKLDPQEEVELLLNSDKNLPETWSISTYEKRAVQVSFRVVANVYLDIRKEPDFDAERVGGEFLKLGDKFEVCEINRSPDMRTYLKLADGRGWVFDWAILNGVRTQLVEPQDDGYAKIKAEKKKFQKVCQRCWGLWHYNDCDDILRPGFGNPHADELAPEKFEDMLKETLADVTDASVLAVIDMFDFGPSFKMMQFLAKTLKGKKGIRVRVVANKLDLLPPEVDLFRIKGWISREAQRAGLARVRITDVYPVSCHKGHGISAVGKLLEQTDAQPAWYIVGAANSGKSSLLNRLSLRKRKGVGEKPANVADGVMVSALPGTTIKPMVLRNQRGRMKVVDTPGLLVEGSLCSKLPMSDLLQIIPQTKECRRVTLDLREKFTIMMGGLARVDMLEGRPFQVTVFTAEKVQLHRCLIERVDIAYQRLVGHTLTPPACANRAAELLPMVPHRFELRGAGWMEACADIVFHGLGWIALTGVGDLVVEAWAPEGVDVTVREPLMPFEAKWTGVKYKGRPGWFKIGNQVTRGFEAGKVRKYVKGQKY